MIDEKDIKEYCNFLGHEKFDIRAFTPRETELEEEVSDGNQWMKSVEDILDFCEKYNGKANLYLGVLPKKSKDKEGVEKIDKIWVELDAEREEDGATSKEALEKSKNVMEKIRNDYRDYGLPLVVMSGNGYHLIWEIEPIELNDKNREKIDKKLNAFVSEIKEEYETDSVEVDTAVGELARILKVPGTRSVKGSKEKWRTAEIVHEPDQTEEQLSNLKDYFLMLEAQPERSGEERPVDESFDEEKFEELKKGDEKLKDLFEGDWEKYDYPSRSEAEYALIHRLLYYEVPEDQIKTVMNRSKIGKWNEEGQQYRDYTLEKAEKECRETISQKDTTKADSVDDSIEPSSEKNPLDRDNLPFISDHLLGFRYVKRGLQLQGEEYKPVRKSTWYQIHSMVMRRTKAELGDITVDLRFHPAYPMPSGAGKKNIIMFLVKVFEEAENQEVSRPTSLHPEQLIGKTIRHGRKDPNFEEIRGHLDDDLVIIDESTDLFRSSKEKIMETRSYLNQALDYYGQNPVTKKMTDIPREERLSYMPDANMTIFLQPFRVDEEFALQGTLRRFIIPYSDFPPQVQIEGYEKRAKGGKDMDLSEAISKLAEQLEGVRKISEGIGDWLYVEDGAVECFVELHRNLVHQGFAHSDKGKNFTRIIDYQLQDLLLKFAGIQAVVSGHKKITEEDIEKGYIDLSDLLACQLRYIYRKVIGSLDYGGEWEGARKNDRKCLKWLKDKGATSKNKSNVSISEYVAKIMEICGVKGRQARRKLKAQEENEWIKRKQVGQHDSKVWLKLDTEDGQGGQDGHGVKTMREIVRGNSPYFELVKKYRGYNPDNPDNPEPEKVETGRDNKGASTDSESYDNFSRTTYGRCEECGKGAGLLNITDDDLDRNVKLCFECANEIYGINEFP